VVVSDVYGDGRHVNIDVVSSVFEGETSAAAAAAAAALVDNNSCSSSSSRGTAGLPAPGPVRGSVLSCCAASSDIAWCCVAQCDSSMQCTSNEHSRGQQCVKALASTWALGCTWGAG
jgi:hypothetical protein